MFKMSLAFILFCLAVNFAEAKTVFSCETSSQVRLGYKTHLKLSQNPTGGFILEKNGQEVSEKDSQAIDDQMVSLTNLDTYYKCATEDSECRKSASLTRGSGYQDFAQVLLMAQGMEKGNPKSGKKSTRKKLDTSKVVAGKSYIFSKKRDDGSDVPQAGVYEFYDMKNNLLGRYFYGMELMECKDKNYPTSEENSSGSGAGSKSIKSNQ